MVDIFFLHSQTRLCAGHGGTLRRLLHLLGVPVTRCAASVHHGEVPLKLDLQD